MFNLKHISRHIALALLGLAFCLPLTAQGPHHGPPGGEARLDQLKTELNLSDEQVAQLKALKEAHKAERMELRQSGERPDPETMHMKREEHRKQMEQILTPEQMEQLKQLRKEKRQEHRATKKAIMQEARPILAEQRAKFETMLSADHKAQINELRAEMKALRPEMKEMRMERKAREGELSEADKAEMKELKTQKKAIMEEVMEIAKVYENELQELHAEIKPQLDQIREAHRPEGMEPGHHQGRRGHHKGQHPQGFQMQGEQGHHRAHMVTRFILMDPNQQDLPPAEAADLQINIFPNPSQDHNTIQYEVLQDGPVRIDLVARDGSLQRTVFEGTQTAGTYELGVDLKDLRPEIYYYTLTTPAGKASQRFTLVR